MNPDEEYRGVFAPDDDEVYEYTATDMEFAWEDGYVNGFSDGKFAAEVNQ